MVGAWLLALSLAAPAAKARPAPAADVVALAHAGQPLWAVLDTDEGELVIALDPRAAPQSVEAFVALATGAREWTNPKGEKVKAPLYDGTSFHRVIPGFLIQGGDPKGNGTGSAGGALPDEAATEPQKALHFTRGAVGLARAPDGKTPGSQLFILVGDAPWLDGHFTRIGTVLHGLEVADRIAARPRGPGDRPLEPVNLKRLSVTDRAPKK